jgi:hypothetical protein
MSGIVSYLQSRQSDRLERGNCGETLAELLPIACPAPQCKKGREDLPFIAGLRESSRRFRNRFGGAR